MPPDSAAQVASIARLERQVRRAQALACGSALLTTTLLLSGYHVGTSQVLQAERLELVTAPGVRRAVLSADSLGFRLVLVDPQGRPAGGLRLNDDPRLSIETERGREVAGLGGPKVHNLTE